MNVVLMMWSFLLQETWSLALHRKHKLAYNSSVSCMLHARSGKEAKMQILTIGNMYVGN